MVDSSIVNDDKLTTKSQYKGMKTMQIVLWCALILVTVANAFFLVRERKQGKPITARVFSLFFCLVILVASLYDGEIKFGEITKKKPWRPLS
jgi:hypothetical protein